MGARRDGVADDPAEGRALTRRPATTPAEPGAPMRLAYRVDEACALLGVSRDTIERAMKDGRLKSGKRLGRRLIDAESLRSMYQDAE